jgi:glycosyltransferase involved in cell wall biosynthesis
MSQKQKLVIINNEKVLFQNDNYYCENLDIKTTSEGLDNEFDVFMIARKSKEKKFNQINLKKINTTSSILGFLIRIFKTFKDKNAKYFLISITPYTFFAFLLLTIFKKKTFVYLRSSGHEEYKVILGFWGPAIYHFMYSLVTAKAKIIVCHEKLARKKESYLVYPSQVDNSWLENHREPNLDKPRLLYIGRLKIEKGIFSLLNIFQNLEDNIELSIVGHSSDPKKVNKRIHYISYVNDINHLINIYDEHNIFILPSYTEAHPQVLYESLARLRPVIIFDEIKHVVKNQEGIFISERNEKALLNTIKFIMNNYKKIQTSIRKNKLPTKQKFIQQIVDILR